MIVPRSVDRLFAAAICVGLCAPAALACKTPVYRYAMYNWEASPYRVYYLHAADIPAADRELHGLFAAGRSEGAKANIELHLLDTRDAAATEKLPAGLREEAAAILRTQGEQPLPSYAVVTPSVTMLHAGALSAADAKALVDSPARDRIAALLAGGHSGVFVLVAGAEESATDVAEQTIKTFLSELKAGKVDLPVPVAPAQEDDGDSADATADVAPPSLKLELVRIARDDPREKWLVESLFHVEEELSERTEPMVFLIYGRGRAHLPCVGKGITSEALAKQAGFILAPCACEVKRENPGLDLLMRADWKSVALAMAERYGAETGNEHLLGGDAFPELFPQIVDAPGVAAVTPVEKKPAEKAATRVSAPPQPATPQPGENPPAEPAVEAASPDTSLAFSQRDVWLVAVLSAALLAVAATWLVRVAMRSP
ncbi:MAG: hypothetical protein WD176_07500 [Pirellulales bacterium]